MGKGDKSTRRGKISAGSYGNARSHSKPSAAAPAAASTAAKAARPAAKAAPRKKA